MANNNYIFGYGSLIETESRTRTTPQAVAASPVIVQGVERGWWAHGSPVGYSSCFLGARMSSNPNARCNGVVYKLSNAELEALDRRENMYERLLIPHESIRFLDDPVSKSLDGKTWIYAMPEHKSGNESKPTAQYPIVQSYVDICLNGCLEIEEAYPAAKDMKFAELFIETTLDWSHFWVNDRLYPRRPFIFVPRCFMIDALLNTALPALFSQIQLEPAIWNNARNE